MKYNDKTAFLKFGEAKSLAKGVLQKMNFR